MKYVDTMKSGKVSLLKSSIRYVPENDFDRAILLNMLKADHTTNFDSPIKVSPDGDGKTYDAYYRIWKNTRETDGVFTATLHVNIEDRNLPATGEVRCVNGAVIVLWHCLEPDKLAHWKLTAKRSLDALTAIKSGDIDASSCEEE